MLQDKVPKSKGCRMVTKLACRKAVYLGTGAEGEGGCQRHKDCMSQDNVLRPGGVGSKRDAEGTRVPMGRNAYVHFFFFV